MYTTQWIMPTCSRLWYVGDAIRWPEDTYRTRSQNRHVVCETVIIMLYWLRHHRGYALLREAADSGHSRALEQVAYAHLVSHHNAQLQIIYNYTYIEYMYRDDWRAKPAHQL